MSRTKQQFVEAAFDELGLGGTDYDLDTTLLTKALIKLERMMSVWSSGKNINVRYPLASSPENASLSTSTEVPNPANKAIDLNLALEIAPSIGAPVSPELKQNAKDALEDLQSWAITDEIPTMQLPGTIPAGAGNKPWRGINDNFLNEPNQDPVYIDSEGDLRLRK